MRWRRVWSYGTVTLTLFAKRPGALFALRLSSVVYYEAGFSLIEVISRLTLSFPILHTGSLLTGVNDHGNSC